MLNVKNRSKEVAHLIVEKMKLGDNQGTFNLSQLKDHQALTSRERMDTSSLVEVETGVKIGLSVGENSLASVSAHGYHYSWETI